MNNMYHILPNKFTGKSHQGPLIQTKGSFIFKTPNENVGIVKGLLQ